VEAWEVAARESIRNTISSYAYYADRGLFDELVALFAPDAVVEVDGIGGARVQGRNALRAFLSGVNETPPPGRMQHHVASVWIDMQSRDTARAASYFSVVTGAGLDHWGRYRDSLIRVGDRWLFAHRLVRTDGVTPGGWADGRR
jgi:ketosteroid isomerase-like protein